LKSYFSDQNLVKHSLVIFFFSLVRSIRGTKIADHFLKRQLVLPEKVTTANTGWFSGQLFNTYIYNHGFRKIKELVSNISKNQRTDF
jgi:putative Mn2+ efflux pump MntP